jgi:glyoxalase family protein
MNNIITGLHHVTALASDARQNVDFYAGILGLRMVKKTVNFDAPDVYHLYYGDETGAPGTIMTFFPFPGISKGRHGKGQMTVTSFSIPTRSLNYWMARLDRFGISYTEPQERFGSEVFIYFEDNDGLGLELVANDHDERKGFTYGQIPSDMAIKGFYGITLTVEGYERTAGLLTGLMNHRHIADGSNRFRFAPEGQINNYVDVVCAPTAMRGLGGNGTVHHVAFATANDASQLEIREKLMKNGFNVSPVMDRQYFHSIYFREPGGILFEVATSDIGFTSDEPKESLGQALKLPSWEEKNRSQIENMLTPIFINIEKFQD